MSDVRPIIIQLPTKRKKETILVLCIGFDMCKLNCAMLRLDFLGRSP